MGPHLKLLKSTSKSQSKFFPHKYHGIVVSLAFCLILTSCEAIAAVNEGKITTATSSIDEKSTSINGSTSRDQDHYDNFHNQRLPTIRAEAEGGRIEGGRYPRNTGWVWSQQNSETTVNTPAVASKSLISQNDTQGQHISKKDKREKLKTAEVVEARGYYTFGDDSTQTYASTTLSNSCFCVPYYLCDEGQVVTLIDIRHGWGCNSVLEVCCRNPRPTPPPTPAPEYTPAPTSPSVTAQPGFTPQCGTLNPNGINARILGFTDSEAQYGEYPWIAAVLESKFIRGKWVLQFLCGASLITPRVVVTAGHCIKGKRASNLKIRLGEWDTQSTNEFYPYQDINVGELVIHPQFYSGGLYNDIALVFLKTSAVLSPHIDTICLPHGNPQYDPSTCFAAGWGKNAFGPSGQYQAILREVELAVIPPDTCQTALRQTNLGPKFNLHSSFLCAGGQKNLDTCIGDGGGPLVCPSLYDKWRYVLVGIVSWGVKCGTYGVPGVYVNVPKFRPWIDSEILRRFPFYNVTRWTVPIVNLPPQGG